MKEIRVAKIHCSFLFSVFILMFPWGIALASDIPSGSLANSNTYQLKEIVVSATRVENSPQDVAANITVVTREEIEKMPAATAAEVLQYVPGVYVEFSGGIGSSSAVRIQGSEVRHVAVFQDGVPLNLLANPMTDLSYIPVDSIERIEVYKGAGSSAWGSSLGGVINIITREPDTQKPFSTNIRTSLGESDTFKKSANASGVVNRFGYFLSVTHDESDGFVEKSAYDQKAAYGKLNYDIGETSRINFVYSYDDGNNQDPVLDYPDFWDDIHQERAYQKFLFETLPAQDIRLSIEGRHHHYDGLIEDVYIDHREIFNDYNDEIWGSSARLTYEAISNNTFNIGFDGDWGQYEWQNYTKTYDTSNWALYANDIYDWNNFAFNAGVRNDANRDFGSEISPSAGLVYKISGADALIRTQVARGFSAPPSAWVQDPVYGNPDLKPEIALNYQLGSDIRIFKFLRTEINFFRADVDDLIRYSPDDRKLVNIDKVTRQGVEGTLAAAFDSGLNVSFSGEFTEVKDKQTNKEIKDIPRVQYTAMTGYTYKWMTHSLYGKYIDHNSTYPETRDKRFVFDYVFNIALPQWNNCLQTGMFCTIHNIFNTQYIYREIWPQPDRWIEAGVNFVY